MKKYFVIAICCVLGFLACTEERPGYYKGEDNWVQFYYVYTFNKTYIAPAYLPYEGYQAYVHSGKLRDTVYYRLHLIGQVSDKPRKVAFEPYETEMKYDYYTPAVEGGNYVAFDDPEMEKFLIIPGDSAYINIPVIVKYNPAVTSYTYYQLDFRLVNTEDLVIGDTCFMKGRLEFYQW